MPFREAEGLRFFQFESLADPNLDHAILTRHGGVSPAPWHSLNYGRTVGDDDARVTENIARGLGATDQALGRAFDVWQVHSATVIRTDQPNLAGGQQELRMPAGWVPCAGWQLSWRKACNKNMDAGRRIW